MKRGRSLEKLVALIEERLASTPQAKVESPAMLADRVTGKPREHDVLVTIDQGHHKLLIALECRDRKRKVGVPQVEAFHTKCGDTGVNQGIIVSPSGFYRSAMKKAQHNKIRCLSLKEAEAFDWLLVPGISVSSLDLKHTNWTIIPAHRPIEPPPTDFSLVDAARRSISIQTLNANVIRKLSSRPPDLTPGSRTDRLLFKGEGIFLRDNRTGKDHPVEALVADAQYEIKLDFAPFKLLQYAEEGSTAAIAEAAVAEIKDGPIHGQFVALRGASGETTISFVKAPPSSSGDTGGA